MICVPDARPFVGFKPHWWIRDTAKGNGTRGRIDPAAPERVKQGARAPLLRRSRANPGC